jgi:hypothetical protein
MNLIFTISRKSKIMCIIELRVNIPVGVDVGVSVGVVDGTAVGGVGQCTEYK